MLTQEKRPKAPPVPTRCPHCGRYCDGQCAMARRPLAAHVRATFDEPWDAREERDQS